MECFKMPKRFTFQKKMKIAKFSFYKPKMNTAKEHVCTL
jgi:hypothetical protein